jgi:hypothetical protein
MTKDYGQRGDPRYARVWTIGGYAFTATAIALAGALGLLGLQNQRDEQAYWDVQGSPCPVLTGSAFAAQTMRPDQAYDYDGVTFTRAFGWMICGQQRARRICQFTNPGIVKVTTGKHDVYFAPGIGQPATVSEQNSQARCVTGANFTG